MTKIDELMQEAKRQQQELEMLELDTYRLEQEINELESRLQQHGDPFEMNEIEWFQKVIIDQGEGWSNEIPF